MLTDLSFVLNWQADCFPTSHITPRNSTPTEPYTHHTLILTKVPSLLPHSPILKNLVVTAVRDTTPLLTPLHPLSHIPGGPHLVSMEGHRDTVSCISTALVPGKQGASVIILTASWDKTLKSWDLATSGVQKTFDGHSERVLCVSLTVDGMYAASGSDDKSVR